MFPANPENAFAYTTQTIAKLQDETELPWKDANIIIEIDGPIFWSSAKGGGQQMLQNTMNSLSVGGEMFLVGRTFISNVAEKLMGDNFSVRVDKENSFGGGYPIHIIRIK